MNQVRFNIGLPKGGSAARIGEDAAGQGLRSVHPEGGSAARQAEERRRAETVPVQRGASLGMRAQGGRVVTAEEMRAASSAPRPEPLASSHGMKVVGTEHPVHASSMAVSAPESAPLTLTTSVLEPTEEIASSGPLQTAAVRIKSLVQSLFSSGGSSSKS
ncbi:MAG: hypothetical protein ACRYGF_16885 [Janthinobacterium lividum]